MPKRYDNTIHKLSLGIKKIIKAIPSSMTKIGLIIYMEDPKEALGVNHIHIKEDTEVEETTVVDIATTIYPIRSDAISTINLDAS
jgi:nicotinamide mononucleotide (NMN) deamidase PncC